MRYELPRGTLEANARRLLEDLLQADHRLPILFDCVRALRKRLRSSTITARAQQGAQIRARQSRCAYRKPKTADQRLRVG
jgi:hypothetical protein